MDSNVDEFSYKRITFVSHTFLICCETIQAILFTISFGVYIILCYVVIRHSPRALGAYKWYIVWNATHGILIGLMFTIFQPEPLLPYTLIIIRGITTIIKLPYWLGYLLVYAIIIILGGTAYTTSCMFVFRWAQTQQSSYIKYLSNMYYYALCYLIYCLLIIGFVIIPLSQQLQFSPYLREAMKNANKEVYDHMLGNFDIIGLNPETGNQYKFSGISALIIFGCIAVVVFHCTISCYKSMLRNWDNLRGKTAKLYKMLLAMLIIDVVIAFFTVFVPVIFIAIGLVNNSQWVSTQFTLTLVMGDCYPLTVNILVLFYIEPYRRYMMFLLGFKNRSKVNFKVTVLTEATTNMP